MKNNLGELHGKKVLISGGGSGMGRATAVKMSENGAIVAIAGRREDALNETVNLVKEGVPPKIFSCDVVDRSSVQSLLDWYDDSFGDLDILVHAAGLNVPNRTMQELTPDDWDRLIQTNLTGSFNLLSLALHRMRPRKQGLVILINSVAGKRSTPLGGVGYNCSKFGMSALGLAVGEEEKDNGIRVTNIYPGEVNTPILNQRKAPPDEIHRSSILQAEDIATIIVNVAKLPGHVHIPELVVKPSQQSFV